MITSSCRDSFYPSRHIIYCHKDILITFTNRKWTHIINALTIRFRAVVEYIRSHVKKISKLTNLKIKSLIKECSVE